PPYSSFYRATLLGEYGAFAGPEEEALQKLGLSHVVAVSGMHISVLFGMVLLVSLSLGASRSLASYGSLILIGGYVALIGAPASAVRAGVMGATLIGAERVGRPNSSWRALLLAAFVMVVANPLILRHDAGFQLSFAAVAGITAAFPYRDRLHPRVPTSWGLRTLLLMTLAAQGATLPLVILHFGTFSLLSIVANILVVPLSPFLLASAMGVAVLGILDAPTILVAPAWFLLEYVFTIALWLA
ncbi:MAG: ComEC/Rec2 family competence protein, partial [Candidatus Spechtbacterales bacterium]